MGLKTNKIHKIYNLLNDMAEDGKLKYNLTSDDFKVACDCVFQVQRQGFAETYNECVAKFYKSQKFIVSYEGTMFVIALN